VTQDHLEYVNVTASGVDQALADCAFGIGGIRLDILTLEETFL
jgi:hypothetical protein